ncbi:Serine-threonine-protein kinase [Halomicronema hongdechloris C2206]|uniref:non-specific serine/threonine protein kinase n=1 Tax=Halomicronema hongdechloris C2206 TaxID=1641165 RepID=A0A1Z3HSQ0_9CYAN|nr:serine/threonine-protein kinase [Halomicronema hongdechloris]ASC73296.1 Serine-threonine-protein kinase [Halomicronema hongdechloris C2206]
MSYCINPKCPDRQQPDSRTVCAACGMALLIQGRYRLLRPLREVDEWGPTDIFAVDDRGTRKVLKLLKQPKLLPLFEREATTLQQLCHPGIPHVDLDGYFTVTTPKGKELHGLVMENIQGQTLENWLAEHGTADSTLAQDWLRQITEILGLVHQNQLFHRDIKLSNIMRRPDGQLALIDFGTVRQMTGTYLAKIGGKRDVTSVVSPGYTPIEQINGKAVPQSDFYALGRSFVYVLTGQHPIDLEEDASTGQISWRHLAPHVPPWFADLIDDLMAPFPGQRPLNAEEILQRLERGLSGWRQRLSPQGVMRLLLAANLCLLLLNLAVGWHWLQRRQSPAASPISTLPGLRSHLTTARPRVHDLSLSHC